MKRSQLLANTLRELPAEAEVVSHQLLLRAGYMRRLTSGIYIYLPLMWRVIQKLAQIVREEMNASGAQELLMPILQPAELWQESGRWEVYGKELMRLEDRHQRPCVLAPTHEEVITAIARSELKSYRQLPVNLYQIQNKYRDEIRPRFGLLRGREFIMKDAYSFHSTWEDLDREYQVMAETYTRIFERCGLETRMVRSDSGAIGGSLSHEFMVLTRILPGEQESGENDVFHCNRCNYAANANRAESILCDAAVTTGDYPQPQALATPGAETIAQLGAQYGIPATVILKSLLYLLDEGTPTQTPIMALIRGDLDIEEVKLKNAFGAHDIRLATAEEIATWSQGAAKGFIGPWKFPSSIAMVADTSVVSLRNFVLAYNQRDMHWVGANWGVELPLPAKVADIRLARVGDGCPECFETDGGVLAMTRGIEVGNIFNLGIKYSEAMRATYTSEQGEETPFIMGCYGIGVSRTAAAAIERFHDKDGMVWPMALAPYQAIVVPVNPGDATQWALAGQVYTCLHEAGVDVLLDDRDERAGVKFKDADLMGFPIRITVGKRAAEGVLELKLRDSKETQDVHHADILATVQQLIATWRPFAMAATSQVPA